MASKGKGSVFERKFCKELSLWWTGQERDDIFWRTSTSGARATVRQKKNKKTAGSAGDICALDPIGQPFLDMFTLELKRGYGRVTMWDLLDKPEKAAKQTYEIWIKQAKQSQKQSGSRSWMIVHQRDRRQTIITTPYAFDFESCYMEFMRGKYNSMLLKDFFEFAKPEEFGK